MEIVVDTYCIKQYDPLIDKRLGDTGMVGYLNKVKGGWVLTICAKPCSGEEFNNAEKITVSGKREAKNICQDRGCTMWNF